MWITIIQETTTIYDLNGPCPYNQNLVCLGARNIVDTFQSANITKTIRDIQKRYFTRRTVLF